MRFLSAPVLVALCLLSDGALAKKPDHKKEQHKSIHKGGHKASPKHTPKSVHKPSKGKPAKGKPGKGKTTKRTKKTTKKSAKPETTKSSKRSSSSSTQTTSSASPTSSGASPSSLYNGLNQGALVPWAENVGTPGSFYFSETPHINFQLTWYSNHSAYTSKRSRAPIDTGSSAFLVGSTVYPGYQNNSELFNSTYETGYEYLSSSKRLYTGFFVPTTVNLFDGKVISNTTVFVVTSEVICNNYPDDVGGPCPAGQIASTECDGNCTVQYMGIGFGRYQDGQQSETPVNNVMLNVIQINGKDTTTLRSGYILTSDGIDVGITENNSANFTLVKLQQTARNLAKDWSQVTGCVSIFLPDVAAQDVPKPAGECVDSNILLDTGVPQSYLRLTPDSGWPADQWTIPPGYPDSLKYTNLTSGTRVQVTFGEAGADGTIKSDFEYSYTVGSDAPNTPTFATARLNETAGAVGFVNTGVYFYRSNDVLFDAIGGYWGIRSHSFTSG